MRFFFLYQQLVTYCLHIQIRDVSTVTEFRDIFLEDYYCTLVAETGYSKPLSQLSLLDRDELCKTVKDYHTLVKILPEMDQFCAGLQTLGVLDMLCKYPEIMQHLFIQAGPRKKLDKGKGFCRLFEGVQQMSL